MADHSGPQITDDDNPWLTSTSTTDQSTKKKKFVRYFEKPTATDSSQAVASSISSGKYIDTANAPSTSKRQTWKSPFDQSSQKRGWDDNVGTLGNEFSIDEELNLDTDGSPWKDNNRLQEFQEDKSVKELKPNYEEKIFIPNLRTNNLKTDRLSNKFEKKRPFSERVPVAPEKLARYSRGEGMNPSGVHTKFHAVKLKQREERIEQAVDQAARTELLLPEEGGFLVPDVGEVSCRYTQKQIAANVDTTSATKHFELQLSQFGPYRMNYNRSGRYLLLGGKKGHVAAIDWVTKRLYCEMNVMEEVYDIQWLHVETMFAVAQKEWVYVYDNTGIELHCLKQMNKVLRMEFLPYHFLLATASEDSYLCWLDISIGKFVTRMDSRMGRLNIMTQNPANAVLCLGHAKGIVSMWSPNVRAPLAKMLCHRQPVSAIAVDHKGLYMATASVDRSLKIWDVRMLEGPLQQYHLGAAATNLAFSQRGLLSVGMGNVVEVYKDCCLQAAEKPYLRHRVGKSIGNFQFCPYEDVLGVASAGGFTSLLTPGAGEPNFDALECNPYQTKSQRKESEVKALLEKIQPEFITLDPSLIAEVDLPSVREKMEAQLKTLNYKPPKVELEHRRKSKGKKGSAKMAQSKKIRREEERKRVNATKQSISDSLLGKDIEEPAGPVSVLDRFKPKRKVKT